MLVNRILCNYSPVLQKMLVSLYKFKIIKLVLRNMWGMFIRMNAELLKVGYLVLCFLDVSRET